MNGLLHSIESFGTVDGPGIRLVVFLKGCPLRCAYCHNPDTWTTDNCGYITADRIIELFEKNHAFYRSGGITVTGGEPLTQIDFLIELFSKAKKKNIHTCLDTSGIIFNKEKLEELLNYTDLVLLDIKQMDAAKHLKLCGKDNANVFLFAELLKERKIDTWIRHVLVPGITDDPNDLLALGKYISTLPNVKALDVLPYHDMAKVKYQSLGISYSLNDVIPPSKEDVKKAKHLILQGMKA